MFKYNFEDEFRVLKVAGTAKRGRTAEPQGSMHAGALHLGVTAL
jgi:hypothetical protein